MNLADVIEGLVDERGLNKDQVVDVVCQGVLAAYQKKFPDLKLEVSFNKKNDQAEIFIEKEVVSSVHDSGKEISLRKSKAYFPKSSLGDLIKVPFEEKIGRIEILVAKQFIATKISELEQAAVFIEFKDKKNSIINGVVYKKERAGTVVKVGDALALLPRENSIPNENLHIGHPVKVLLKEVLEFARSGYQLILDRASSEFVKKIISLEIPEVFEGVVEIKKAVRIPGYKTKIIVISHGKDIDPVGTCIGFGGARIKPILKELGREKIDLIQWSDSLETLIKHSLKPADIDRVEILDGGKAIVWLDQDQRSYAIGKMGQNILLASKLVGLDLQLQDAHPVSRVDLDEYASKNDIQSESQEKKIDDLHLAKDEDREDLE